MAAAPLPTPPGGPVVAVTATGERRAVLVLAGDVGAGALRELEERLTVPPLSEAGEWTVDLSAVTRIDLACAYALLRAATQRPETVTLLLRGARRPVQRTLRHAGLDAVAVIEE
ncbi:STAS domain-containing protein [Streptomyces sp. JJ36]|uniref:STAS domain-containing protein n=1 Tax=Streptomyces sp. JJ36 TaxID=2736645 RepID=UPI001F2AA79B|nr:STAS domain-containing protein [Streptomyces sp. JJ36]MCF6524792.1 STAS domain-containing protein [Streptomyces sp. JJ36]